MKKLIWVLLLLSAGLPVAAQTFGEWFNQKKTQKKYLLEQIAALKAYGVVIKGGYKAAKKGLTLVSDIKNRDFLQHDRFFKARTFAGNVVKENKQVAGILEIQDRVSSVINRCRKRYRTSGYFSTSERDYLDGVYQRLESDCLETIKELENVISDAQLNMSDDERINRITSLYYTSVDQQDFAQNFSSKIMVIDINRQKERKDIDNLRALHGIKAN